MATSTKKKAGAVAAVAVAAALALGGTFAWQGYQSALNEASDVVNPGGRLHDDFDGSNKDVYVENFADDPIFARVRLSEYFEITSNYGVEGVESTTTLLGSKGDDGSYVYELFDDYGSLADGAVAAGVSGTYDADAAEGDAGYSWWTWETGGSTYYMPTFNMNKDSLVADLNGVYENGAVGTISERNGSQYTGYVEYGEGDTLVGTEIYDADANSADEVGGDFDNLDAYVNAGNVVAVSTDEDGDAITHEAAETASGRLVSMADWLEMLEGAEAGYDPVDHGGCWVYDTDGWVYWSQPIEPRSATGLLLDGIELNQAMDDTWYYAIDVEAQFVTADDLGAEDGTGFYANGERPSPEALALLQAIGAMGTVEEDSGSDSTGELEDVLVVYVTPDKLKVTVAAQYGQEIRVALKDFPEGVTFSDEIVRDGLDAGTTEENSQVYINYGEWSWRTEELMYSRSLIAPLSGYDDGSAVEVELVNRISIVGADVVSNGKAAPLALLNEDGSRVESLSGATFSVSPARAGVLSAESSVDGANMTFAPSKDFTGAVDLTVTYDGVNYRRSILVVQPDEATAVLLYHHDGLGWFLPHETIYKGQWYSYFLVADGVFQDVTPPEDETSFGKTSKGWSITDGVEAADYIGWNGLAFDRQIAYALPRDAEDTSEHLTIGYESGGLSVETTYGSVPTPEVKIYGKETELSISGGEAYAFTVSEVDPRDGRLRANIRFERVAGYEYWDEYEYDCAFEVNEDNTVSITVDLSGWEYGPVDDARLRFFCFNDYHTLEVSIVE